MNSQSVVSAIKANLKAFFHPASSPRIMLFLPAVLLLLITSGLSGAAFILNSGPLYIAGMVLWVVWIGTLFLIALPVSDKLLERARVWLKPVSITLAGVLVVTGLLEFALLSVVSHGGSVFNFVGPSTNTLLEEQAINFRYNDGTALCHQAVDNLLDAKNPYTSANIVSANILFGNPFDRTTPLRVERFANDFPYPTQAELKTVWDQAIKDPSIIPPEIESKLNYPAASFLIPAPFIWMGVGDLRWVYLVAIVIGLICAFFMVPAGIRLWLLLGGLASLEIWESVASGETGGLAFPFLLIAWMLWRRKWWLSALCMGVAVAIKQVAWFFVPFYFILIWRMIGWKRAATALSFIGGVFMAFNVVFIIQNPAVWLNSIMAPLTDKLFPLGVGPVTLVIAGYIKTQSSLVFTLMEIGAMLASMFWYWHNCRRFPYTGIVLAVVPLFFAWRSSWWYFFYFDLILLATIMLNDYDRQSKPLYLVESSTP